MSTRFYLLLSSLLLLGCETRRPAAETAAPPATPPPAPPSPSTAALPQTAFAQPLTYEDTTSTPRFRPIAIGGLTYQLSTSAEADSTQLLQKVFRYQVPEEDENGKSRLVTRIDTARSYEVRYRFRLRDAQGREVFDQTLRKSRELAPALAADVYDTDAFQPRYRGYWPAAGSLLFAVHFGPDGSDTGGELLLLLDARTGKLRHAGISKVWLTNVSSIAPALSADGRSLLTHYELLHADGRVVPLEQKQLQTGAAIWLNEHTMLVSYYPEVDEHWKPRPLRRSNNRILDEQGRELASFMAPLVTEAELGYGWAYHYLPGTRTHYFADEAGRRLCLIRRDAPTQPQLLPLRSLPRFAPPRRPQEVVLPMGEGERGTAVQLYVDTLSGGLRYDLRGQ